LSPGTVTLNYSIDRSRNFFSPISRKPPPFHTAISNPNEIVVWAKRVGAGGVGDAKSVYLDGHVFCI